MSIFLEDKPHNEERTARGVDKVAVYKWTVADRVGRFEWIEKNRLEINHQDYQRTANDSKVLEIASAWSWIACGSITVGYREGRFWGIEGQYRTLAARRRSDIKKMPCMVFDCSDVREEAAGFLRSNTNRKPITSLDKFKALTTTGDENARFVNDLLEGSGRANYESARCLTAVLVAAKQSRNELVTVWPILCELCKGRAIHGHLMRALVWLERKMPDGASLADRKWAQRLIDAGYDDLMDAMHKASLFRGKGGERVWGEGILAKLNHGLRNKIEI